MGAELTSARYLFAGTDVTDEVAALAAVADSDLGAGGSDCAIAAAQILSGLARSVDAHDVARALEALDTRRPAAGSEPPPAVAPEAVRAALILLAPLLLPARDERAPRAA
jgi:hypothetical protein